MKKDSHFLVIFCDFIRPKSMQTSFREKRPKGTFSCVHMLFKISFYHLYVMNSKTIINGQKNQDINQFLTSLQKLEFSNQKHKP